MTIETSQISNIELSNISRQGTCLAAFATEDMSAAATGDTSHVATEDTAPVATEDMCSATSIQYEQHHGITNSKN